MTNQVRFEVGECGIGGYLELNGQRLEGVKGVEVITKVGEPTLVKITILAHIFGEVVAKVIEFEAKESLAKSKRPGPLETPTPGSTIEIL